MPKSPLIPSTLGQWVSTQRKRKSEGMLSDERIHLLDDIGFVWDQFEQEWQENYRHLKQYADANGNTSVAHDHPMLGNWISLQRTVRKTGKLSSKRIQLLDEIGFIWDQRDYEWQEKYALVKQYLDENGDAKIPARHPTLGKWISTQRYEKKKGQLTDERIQLLDAIGIIWDPLDQEWREKYQELQQFIDKNPNDKVSAKHPSLGAWVSKQRTAKRNGKLSDEYTQLLDNVAFAWNPLEEERQKWQEQYEQLKQYFDENNHLRVPRGHPILGYWVSTQRRRRKKGTLSEEQIELLDKLGFIWDPGK